MPPPPGKRHPRAPRFVRHGAWGLLFAAACTAVAGLDDLTFESAASGGSDMGGGDTSSSTSVTSGGGSTSTPLPPGSPCIEPAQCGTGFCVDGVCCESGCAAACERCGDDGACRLDEPGTACQVANDVDGVCTLGGQCLLPNGATCRAATDCATGFCVDDRCCGSACNGICERCDLPATAGECERAPVNTDPDDDCNGSCCGIMGDCGATCT